jgi:hypothetical protein
MLSKDKGLRKTSSSLKKRIVPPLGRFVFSLREKLALRHPAAFAKAYTNISIMMLERPLVASSTKNTR